MERRRAEETDPAVLEAMQRGWCLGSEGDKRQTLLRMEGGLGEHHSGELHRQAAGAKAERIVAAELRRLGWKAGDLEERRKNDPDKLEIAARLRRETTLSVKEIAARMPLGTSKGANRNLHNHTGSGSPPATGQAPPPTKGNPDSTK
jgi:hypothetical protein